MRIYKALFFLALLALTACSKPAPRGIIPPEEMAPIIADLHIVDGSMFNVPSSPDTLYKYGMSNYSLVFKRHHVDSLQFNKSFRYYTTAPKTLSAIYDQVVQLLQAKYDSVVKIKPKPVKKPAQSATTPRPNAVPAK